MKKIFFSVFIFLMMIGAAGFAQSFHAGFKGGANINKVEGKAFSNEFRHGYNGGAFAEINFSKKWGIQPELIWNQSQTVVSQRFKDLYDEGLSELKGVKLDYLSIPLLLSYTPAKFISFQAGPQFGILINKDDNLLQNGKEAFKSGDFSLLGGVQVNIGSMKVGGRYALGLSNISEIRDVDKWRNNGFQLYVGFRII